MRHKDAKNICIQDPAQNLAMSVIVKAHFPMEISNYTNNEFYLTNICFKCKLLNLSY